MEAAVVRSPVATLPMRVARLSLSHFRNYGALRLDLDDGPVVLTGENGAGKTNILEAVSFLMPGRGFRGAAYREIDRDGQAAWGVHAEVEGAGGFVTIGTGRDAESETDRRIVRIDGKTARAEALARVFSAVWLTPQMDGLLREGGTARRKFLDRMVYAFEPEHAARVTAYEGAMRERARLLEAGRMDDGWLSALEARMSGEGVAIALSRAATVERLNLAVARSEGPFPKAHLALQGEVETWLLAGKAAQAEQAFAERLRGNRSLDRASGRTASGAHRSTLIVTHTGKGRPADECSTGEQKAMLLSLTLSLARARALWTGSTPVLLLDEVVAHLDVQKRGWLFEELGALGAQSWLTGTDADAFVGLENARRFSVADGVVA